MKVVRLAGGTMHSHRCVCQLDQVWERSVSDSCACLCLLSDFSLNKQGCDWNIPTRVSWGFSHVTLWNTRYVCRLRSSEVSLTGVRWGTGTAWAWGAELDCTCKLWEVRTGDWSGDERGVDSAWSRYEYVEDFSQSFLFVSLKCTVTDLDDNAACL
jgi:hypothetical protein